MHDLCKSNKKGVLKYMLSELFGLLSSVDVGRGSGKNRKLSVNLNKNRIRSISAFSSNSIFYFPTVVTDQAMPEEIAMVSRMIEKSYASFVVACISLMPFHRVKADDKAAIEDYLAQFHQNMGMNPGSGPVLNKMFGFVDSLDLSESAISEKEAVEELQSFLYESWQRSLQENTDFIKIVSETISLNDMFNIDAVDPKTRVLQEQFKATQDELDTWGFIGEATDDLFDFDDDDFEDDDDFDDIDEDELDDSILDDLNESSSMNEGSVKSAIDSIKFSLESVSENKILSCDSLTKLSALENKLNKLKHKYTKYLNRYKKKYKENEKSGSNAKLSIRFNNMTISDPKAFMQQYGKYIKIINKRLKLIDKRRAQLRKRKGLEESTTGELNVMTTLSQMDFDAIDFCDRAISECLSAPDSEIFTLTEAKSGPSERQMRDFMDRQSRKHQGEMAKADRERRLADKRNQEKLDAMQKNHDRQLDKMKDKHEREIQRIKDDQKLTRADRANMARDKQAGNDDFDMVYDRSRPKSGINPYLAGDAHHTEFKTFDREVFTDMDMKKANEAIPIFAKASIGFIVDETEEVVSRDVLVGIKAYIHKAPSIELINGAYNCIINKRKFLRLVKFVTGEERSLADLLFGFKELKSDAIESRRDNSWNAAFKRRRRWSKMSVPYLTKEYTPNGTIVMTMNEVNFIKSQYGIDIMTPAHTEMIMDNEFLLGFVILDQAEEMVYVTYDGHGYGFQQYTYAMLEREQQSSDRMMRELYRSFSK